MLYYRYSKHLLYLLKRKKSQRETEKDLSARNEGETVSQSWMPVRIHLAAAGTPEGAVD